MHDPFNLRRFVSAQDPVFDRVLTELRDGQKRSHWMWFVFPQIQGLGHSEISRRYAITCRAEADAYLHHPVLGPRLEACTQLVNATEGRSAYDIFGSPDNMKFHSCMTLFAAVSPGASIYSQALGRYFAGSPDPATVDRL